MFSLEVLVCDRCGGPRRVLGAVTEPHAVRRLLAALGLAGEGRPEGPGRGRGPRWVARDRWLAPPTFERTGRGQAIDVSMLEGQLSLLGSMIGGYLADGETPEPMGTAYKALLPYQTFRTKTRDLALAVGSEKLWKIFCPAIGRPELTDDPRYRTNADRAQHRESLIATLQETFLTRPYEEWEPILLDQGIPFGAINRISEVVDHPQVKARGALVEMRHPRAGTVRMVGVPVRLSETPGAVRTPSPTLGEHTEEVLRDLLGLPADEIAALRAAGVIR